MERKIKRKMFKQRRDTQTQYIVILFKYPFIGRANDI